MKLADKACRLRSCAAGSSSKQARSSGAPSFTRRAPTATASDESLLCSEAHGEHGPGGARCASSAAARPRHPSPRWSTRTYDSGSSGRSPRTPRSATLAGDDVRTAHGAAAAPRNIGRSLELMRRTGSGGSRGLLERRDPPPGTRCCEAEERVAIMDSSCDVDDRRWRGVRLCTSGRDGRSTVRCCSRVGSARAAAARAEGGWSDSVGTFRARSRPATAKTSGRSCRCSSETARRGRCRSATAWSSCRRGVGRAAPGDVSEENLAKLAEEAKASMAQPQVGGE